MIPSQKRQARCRADLSGGIAVMRTAESGSLRVGHLDGYNRFSDAFYGATRQWPTHASS